MMLTGLSLQPPQSAQGARHSTQIKEFSAIRRLEISSDDPNGSLLNEAVAVHLEQVDHADTFSDGDQDKDASSALLRRKLEDLERSRKKFMKHLNEDQKSNLEKSRNTTEAVLATIDSANFDWCKRMESGTGAVSTFKRKFHQACKALDQHATMFSMLPKENEYVAVFYGAFNTIVTASVMHQAMASGLPKIVDELNSIVRDIAKKIDLYPQAKRQIRRVLIELYIRIFDLLSRLMEWYSKNKHLFKILRKDCYNDFESDLRDIRTWAGLIRSEVQTNMVLEMRQVQDENRAYLMQEQQRTAEVAEKYFGASAKETMVQMAREQQNLLEAFENRLMSRFSHCFKTIGACQTGTLASMAETISPSPRLGALDPAIGYNQDRVIAIGESTEVAIDIMTVHTTNEPSSTATQLPQITRSEIERHSRILDNWYPEGHMHPIQRPGPPTRPEMYEALAARLSKWTRSRSSQILCIQLPYKNNTTISPSLGSSIASYVVSSAWEVHFPILSYFCSLPRTAPPRRTVQTVALSEMMAALVRQGVSLLPEGVLPGTAAGLDEARFRGLDGTLRTWEGVLGVLAQVLALVKGDLLVVLHGLQGLDGEATTERVVELLEVFRKRVDCGERETTGTTKVLLVNEGRSRAVVPWLRRGELSMHEGA